jgi:cation diffusion facilitator CzcD-associated flavoprotein CzcO
MMTDYSDILDIAIIGAGPGGLSAAHALTQRGFSVGIFEKASSSTRSDIPR